MTKITTDFEGVEPRDVVRARLIEIAGWWGYAPGSWGAARAALNELLTGTSLGTIAATEFEDDFLPKLNLCNDPDELVVDSLFRNDEDGTLPDFTQVFTDTAGTTPADWGDSVARVNDRSGNDRHTVQSSAALRGLLGRAPVAGRRNLLVNTLFAGATAGKPGSAPSSYAFDINNAELTTPQAGRLGVIATAERTVVRGPTALSFGANQTKTFSGLVNVISGDLTFDNCFSWTVLGGVTYTYKINGETVSPTTVLPLGVSLLEVIATTGATPENLNTRFGIGLVSNGTGHIEVSDIQAEDGSERTNYQPVNDVNGLDVTEPGFPSPAFIRFDLSDDVLPTTFPDGGTFDVMVFGRGGSWIERDVEIAPAGSLNIGPRSFTGAPAGVLAALGDIVGWTAVDRTLTDAEIARLVRYYKARGAKGLLVPGDELLVNNDFSDGDAGWTLTVDGTGTASIAGGELQLAGTDASNRGRLSRDLDGVVTSGAIYLATADVTAFSGAEGTFGVGAVIGGGQRGFTSITGTGTKRTLIYPTGGVNLFYSQPSSSGADFTTDAFSLRELRPQEDW